MRRLLFVAAILIAIALPSTLRAQAAPDFTPFMRNWSNHLSRFTVDSAGLVWGGSSDERTPLVANERLFRASDGTAFGYNLRTGQAVALTLWRNDTVLWQTAEDAPGIVFWGARTGPPDFSPFQQEWAVHIGVMTVSRDGAVSYAGRNAPQSQVAQLTMVHGDTAYGMSASGGPFMLTLLPNDLLVVDAFDGQSSHLFCGPDMDADMAEQLTGSRSPCGA